MSSASYAISEPSDNKGSHPLGNEGILFGTGYTRIFIFILLGVILIGATFFGTAYYFVGEEPKIESKIVRHTFIVSYISGRPDGVQHNYILGINGAFPGPQIEAMVGDTLEVTVVNRMQDEVTGREGGDGTDVTLHWHGFQQRGTPFEDGPSFITQCPLKSGSSQKYTFLMDLPGTYWYYSHVMSQYTAGLWGVIIVRSPKEVYSYDGELTITLNDWYHNSTLENDAWYSAPKMRPSSPYPDSVLMNGMGRYPCGLAKQRGGFSCNPNGQKRPVFYLSPGKVYRIRVINTSGLTAFDFSVDGHTLETIEVYSLDVKTPVRADVATIAAAQRYSFILRTNLYYRRGTSILIRARTLLPLNPPSTNNINPFPDLLQPYRFGVLTGVIRINYGSFNPVLQSSEAFDHTAQLELAPTPTLRLNDSLLLPHDGELAVRRVQHRFVFEVARATLEDGMRRLFFKGGQIREPFILPSSGKPLLARMIQGNAQPPRSNVLNLGYRNGVQVTVYNNVAGRHPLHLHGHHFHVLYNGADNSGFYKPTERQLAALPLNTMKRDTVLINNNSTVIIRFVADNPGFCMLHCHIDWHMASGMVVNFAEAVTQVGKIPVTSDCREQGIFI